MIKNILGNMFQQEEEEEEGGTCGCLCDCYPHPRGGSYSDGYLAGTRDGARV